MKLVLIGASAGSVCALEKIVRSLENIKGTVIFCVHLNFSLVDPFIEILQEHAKVPVRKGMDGTILQEGSIYICDTKTNIVYERIDGNEMLFGSKVHESIYTPSIDELFISVAKKKKNPQEVLAILLSGIGSDGVEGMKRLLQNGATTMTTSKEHSVVYGIPKMAVQQRASKEVLGLDEIIEKIKDFLL